MSTRTLPGKQNQVSVPARPLIISYANAKGQLWPWPGGPRIPQLSNKARSLVRSDAGALLIVGALVEAGKGTFFNAREIKPADVAPNPVLGYEEITKSEIVPEIRLRFIRAEAEGLHVHCRRGFEVKWGTVGPDCFDGGRAEPLFIPWSALEAVLRARSSGIQRLKRFPLRFDDRTQFPLLTGWAEAQELGLLINPNEYAAFYEHAPFENKN